MRTYYETDGEIIQKAFKNKGYEITLQEAITFWGERSETNASDWLLLPHDDLEEIFEMVMSESSAPEILERKRVLTELEIFFDTTVSGSKRQEAEKILNRLKEFI